MTGRPCDVVLICPTLDPMRGARTLDEARAAAGITCGVILASDQEKRGAVAINNVLLRAALDWGARVVGYVNDDTWGFPQGWLKRLVEVLDEWPKAGVAVTGAPCRSNPQRRGRPGLPPAVIEVARPTAWVVAAIRAETIREVGWLDEELIHYADDSDFEMRMHAAGWASVYVQDVFVQHETGDGHWIADWYDHDKRRFIATWGKV